MSDLVRIPFSYGDIVYHRAKSERIAGMVTGYSLFPGGMHVLVTWENDLTEKRHYLCELAAEFEPSYATEGEI